MSSCAALLHRKRKIMKDTHLGAYFRKKPKTEKNPKTDDKASSQQSETSGRGPTESIDVDREPAQADAIAAKGCLPTTKRKQRAAMHT